MQKKDNINGYELSRNWFDFCFENPEKITPAHTALYFFAIEHCNRLGWKEKFGLPSQMAMDAIGIKNWRTYIKAFNDIINWNFFKLISKSKNQYSATVIALVKNTKANTKALAKAIQKHSQKQDICIVGINKPITIEPITKEQGNGKHLAFPSENTNPFPSSTLIDYNLISKTYKQENPNLTQIRNLTPKRKSVIKTRFNEVGMPGILEVISKTGKSNFLQGTNSRNWKADFDWIFQSKNFHKILEGGHDNPSIISAPQANTKIPVNF